MSNVSVSLSADFLHFGHSVVFHPLCCSRGFPGLSKTTSSGSVTGRFFSSTGIGPHSPQWIIGIGQPQYLCLDIPQSLSLKFISFFPLFFNISFSEALSFASETLKPSRKSELIISPSPVYASFFNLRLSTLSPSGQTTGITGILYFCANS